MTSQRLTSLNNSTSKQFYSFSKGERFPTKKSLNAISAYDKKSQFDSPTSGGVGRPFFQTSTRFDYYNSPTKEKKAPQPSPLHYKLGNTFGPESRKLNESYSFGVGRTNMKKLYIDDIQSKGDKALPGPGKYEKDPTFGKAGLHCSFAARLPTERQMLEKSAKLPGPGSYNHVDVTGNDQKQSNILTQSKFSFGKANDRWQAPTKKVAAPAPDTYTPMNNLNQNYNSTFQRSGQTVIGKSTHSIIDQHFNQQIKSPGPGAYNRFSDFSGTQ